MGVCFLEGEIQSDPVTGVDLENRLIEEQRFTLPKFQPIPLKSKAYRYVIMNVILRIATSPASLPHHAHIGWRRERVGVPDFWQLLSGPSKQGHRRAAALQARDAQQQKSCEV